ncbi:hypothetical protein FQN50_008079 [Emmonsiellopsis sp. PD_5]|nr:hypothetical protein FQN50_008079 [Emmonsiellopsis sp. PD_5]
MPNRLQLTGDRMNAYEPSPIFQQSKFWHYRNVADVGQRRILVKIQRSGTNTFYKDVDLICYMFGRRMTAIRWIIMALTASPPQDKLGL